MAVVSMLGPMMYLIPSLASFSAFEMEILGSFLSSSATISILYFLPPMLTPPLLLYISAVVSAQYLLTRPHDAAAPDMTPLTPIFRTSSACASGIVPNIAKVSAARVFKDMRLFIITPVWLVGYTTIYAKDLTSHRQASCLACSFV